MKDKILLGVIIALSLTLVVLVRMVMWTPSQIIKVPGDTKIVEVEKVKIVRVPDMSMCPQPNRMWSDTSDLLTAVPSELSYAYSKVFVSEDNCVIWPEGKGSKRHPECGTDGKLSDDAKAIVQVTRNTARMRGESELEALKLLAKSPMCERDPAKMTDRQKWVCSLQQDGDSPPDSWRECTPGMKRGACDGVWSLYVDKWVRLRDVETPRYLGSLNPDTPCPPSVLSWGTNRDAETIAIPKRGHVRYDCCERNWCGGPPLEEEHASL